MWLLWDVTSAACQATSSAPHALDVTSRFEQRVLASPAVHSQQSVTAWLPVCLSKHLAPAAQFLFDTAESDYRGGEADVAAVDRLIVTSGKMVLLDKLLRRLKDTGHRHALCLLPVSVKRACLAV